MYKSNVVNPNDSPVNNVCILLFNNYYYPLTSLPAWYGHHHYCIECEVRYTNKHTCKPVRICSKCSETNCHPSPHLPDVAKSVLALFAIVPVSDIICQTVCVTIQSYVTHVASGSSVQCLNTWKYVFYDFECTQNTIDTETKGPVHEVNSCIAMSICDKCPDDGSGDDCLPVHTFSGLGGQNALEKLCKWAFDHPVNDGAVVIMMPNLYCLIRLQMGNTLKFWLMEESCWK